MRIISAELIGWRNYEHQSLDFESSPTILVGPNGQGKTNFVEALIYAALGHSHRSASDAILVKSGALEAIIRMMVQYDTRRLAVDLRVEAGRVGGWGECVWAAARHVPACRQNRRLRGRAQQEAGREQALNKGSNTSRAQGLLRCAGAPCRR